MSLNRKFYESITNKSNTPIAELFFSKVNLDYIQNKIVECVNQEIKIKYGNRSKHLISRQSDREILILMASIYDFFQSPKSILNNGKPPTIYNMAPIPAQFLFSDVGNRYIPEENNINEKYKVDNYYAREQRNSLCYPNHKYHYQQSFNADLTKGNVVNHRYFDPNVPIDIKVNFLNDMFLEHIIPKILLEIHSYLEYHFQIFDRSSCILDYPEYVPKRNTKEISLQPYYSGTDEEFIQIHNKNNIQFPKIKRNFTDVKKFKQHTGKSLTEDTINNRIPMGETDILFDSKKQEGRFEERRKNMDKI
jgi:hypothetical protein